MSFRGLAVSAGLGSQLGDRETGIDAAQRVHFDARGARQQIIYSVFSGTLAEIEARAGREGLARIDAATALATEMGAHWSDAFLHHIRGKILLKCDPANTAAAEEALLRRHRCRATAKGSSLELRAALSLAKLYQINRPRRRSSCRARARARRLFADAGIPRDRRSARATATLPS